MNTRIEPQKVVLTKRQRQILYMKSLGLTAKQIAKALEISPETVKKHQKKAGEKLGLETGRVNAIITVLHQRTWL